MIAKHPGPCRPHEYQDQKYGEGFRLMTEGRTGFRCTVCGAPGKKENMKARPGFKLDQLIVKRGS